MAFNIMDLFSQTALNRLLQPAQNAEGVQNFLASPQAAAQFDPARFAGSDRLPAVGMDALRERMDGQPVNVAQASPQSDPWAGLREQDVVQVDPTMTGATRQPAQPAQAVAQKPGSLFPSIDKAALNDMFLGMAMGQTPQQSLALGAAQAARGKRGRDDVNQTVEWLKGRGMDEGQARMVASSPETLQQYLTQMMTPQDPAKALQLEKMGLEIDNLRNPRPDQTALMQNLAAAGIQPGTQEYRDAILAGTKTGTNVNIGGGENSADAELRKKLSGKEGEAWAGYKEAGTVSAGSAQDMQLLDQLITMAPQGPIEGRIAQMFPGVSSAGGAFESVVKRVAPTLRAPGSGATSDIEYDGMLKSLPSLTNRPETNVAISSMMKAKAAINVERSQVIDAYQNEQITAAEARQRLAELNSRSIMTPDIETAFQKIGLNVRSGETNKQDPLGLR